MSDVTQCLLLLVLKVYRQQMGGVEKQPLGNDLSNARYRDRRSFTSLPYSFQFDDWDGVYHCISYTSSFKVLERELGRCTTEAFVRRRNGVMWK